MFESISSYSNSGLSSMMQQMEQMQSYIDGKYTISKESLDSLQEYYEEEGTTTPEDLKKMIENYEVIDKNGNGIDYAELATFAKKNDIDISGLDELNKNRSMEKYNSMIGSILLDESAQDDILGSLYGAGSSSSSSSYSSALLNALNDSDGTSSTIYNNSYNYSSALLSAYSDSSSNTSGGLSALL